GETDDRNDRDREHRRDAAAAISQETGEQHVTHPGCKHCGRLARRLLDSVESLADFPSHLVYAPVTTRCRASRRRVAMDRTTGMPVPRSGQELTLRLRNYRSRAGERDGCGAHMTIGGRPCARPRRRIPAGLSLGCRPRAPHPFGVLRGFFLFAELHIVFVNYESVARVRP